MWIGAAIFFIIVLLYIKGQNLKWKQWPPMHLLRKILGKEKEEEREDIL